MGLPVRERLKYFPTEKSAGVPFYGARLEGMPRDWITGRKAGNPRKVGSGGTKDAGNR